MHVSPALESSPSRIQHAPSGKTTNHLPFVDCTSVGVKTGTAGPVDECTQQCSCHCHAQHSRAACVLIGCRLNWAVCVVCGVCMCVRV